jgi:hypothetical protein
LKVGKEERNRHFGGREDKYTSSSPSKPLSANNRPEASLLVKNYHVLKIQMSHTEQLVRTLQKTDLVPHLGTLVKYFQFGEKYLEKLVSTSVTVKDKKQKIEKIRSHIQKL